MKVKLSKYFGAISLWFCLGILAMNWTGAATAFKLNLDGVVIIIMLAVCSWAITIGAKLVEREHPSANKIFPSCIVAYILVLVMLQYWYQHMS